MAQVTFVEIECKSILNRVNGACPPFRWTINPYRGCQHACVYCFARSTHEYLGFDVGRDFDRRIVVKVNAPQVLRHELERPSWRGELVALGTACDPYQPAEGKYCLTRRILQVLLDHLNPVSITTKSALVLRDADILQELAERTHIHVNFSVATLDEKIWREIEPGTPHPLKRLEAMAQLVHLGIPAGVLMAPIIPGLTDDQKHMEAVVRAAAEHDAQYLAPNVLHLRPGSREWFLPFLREAHPHLLPQYARLYRGPYAPETYTRLVMQRIETLRQRYGLGEHHRIPEEPRGQLTLPLAS